MFQRMTVPMTGRLVRVTALVLAAGLALAPRLHAQLTPPTTAFTLSLPETVVTAIRNADGSGVPWDLVRRYGFSLSVLGQGEFTVSVVAMVVAKGKVVRTWTSAKRQVAAGTTALSGRDFLPSDQFLPGEQVLGEQAGKTVSVEDAKRAIAGGSASTLLGSVSTSTNGVIFVLIPDGTGKSTTTNPRFVKTKDLID